jgi:hypothetical protein
VAGGSGRDTISYEERDASLPVTIKLDGTPTSGVTNAPPDPPEKDTLATDIENVVGSPANDTIVATAETNQIDSGDGNDVIDPGAGADVIDAGPGDDTLKVRDGAQDTVDCGAGNDVVTNCEQVSKSRELMSDVDNDGVPAPADCDDRDAKRRPGLPDKPGNGIDEDCLNGDAPFPRVLSGVSSKFKTGARTIVQALTVIDLPPGARIELLCKGKKCFKGTKKVTVPAAGAGQINARKPLAKIKFRPGQILEVRVLAPDMIGKVVDLKMKKNNLPVSTVLCLPPGKASPEKCQR